MQTFSAHYQDLFPKIYSFIYYRVNDRQTAEDLTSQTFLKGFENFEHFDPTKASVKTWLYTIARNTLIDHFRKTRASVDLEAAEEVPSEEMILESIIANEENKELRALLSTLPKDARSLILMRLWDELSYQEIAEITGKSEASLKMTYSRALTQLRNYE
ncbi:MAG: RNA polymerase sigma factor [Candidatus Gracilibacteria bacterium]|jgi:RNA polymerase sigma-70 factor (ECF subfamily)